MRQTRIWVVVGFAVASVALTGCGKSAPASPRVEDSTVAAMRTAIGGSAKTDAGPAAGGAKFKHAGGFVAVKGRVKFTGTAPERPALKAEKDPQVCAPNGPPLSEKLIVAGDGGVANVVIYLESEPA